MSDQELSERKLELAAENGIKAYIAELENQLVEAQRDHNALKELVALIAKERDQAIQERDAAQAETKIRTESLQTAVRLKLQAQSQRDALAKALRELVDMYVANKGTKYEFITCITPPVSSQMSVEQRAKSKTWKAWDNAREALAALDRTAPADGGKA